MEWEWVWVERLVVGSLEVAVDEAVEVVGRIEAELVFEAGTGVVRLPEH